MRLISGKEGGKFLHAANFPLIPGFDFAGVVEHVGEAVRDLKKDQNIFGFLPYAKTTTAGTLSSHVVVDPDWLSPMPDNVSYAQAAAVATCGSTALQGLRDKGLLAARQHILINGASGGVGSCAVQIAKHAGATVWGTCSRKNMAFVQKLGADRVFDYNRMPLEKMENKFDVIFDVASTSSFGACRGLLNRKGVHITLLPSLALAAGIAKSLFSSKASRFVGV